MDRVGVGICEGTLSPSCSNAQSIEHLSKDLDRMRGGIRDGKAAIVHLKARLEEEKAGIQAEQVAFTILLNCSIESISLSLVTICYTT